MVIKMSQTILPFLKFLLIQLLIAIVGLNIIRDKGICPSMVLKSWIFGHVLLLAVFQIIAVPMILLKWKFGILYWSYLCVSSVLLGFGLWEIKNRKWNLKIEKKSFTWLAITLLVIVIVLVLFQSGVYFFGIHLDEDDARWLAEANDALEYGHMMTVDFDTGEYIAKFRQARDAISPLPMYWATLSRILNVRPAVFAHTIYPPIAMLLVYAIYWLIGRELFVKIESRTFFILCVIVINLFFGRTVNTQSTFTLIRIWQGKATVAGIIIPLLLYVFICIHKSNEVKDWLKLPSVGCAACLLSGMGISISGIIIGIYGLYDIITYRRWKRSPLLLLAIIPIVSYGLISLILSGGAMDKQ